MAESKDKKYKDELAVASSFSLRNLVDYVNTNNADPTKEKILREDIITILKERDNFFLIYYK